MRAALLTEYRKIVTTRLWWILLLSMFVYLLGIGAAMVWSLSMGDAMGTGGGSSVKLLGVDLAALVYSIGVTIGSVFPLVVGTLSVTAEFRSQTITPTFLAEPRRGVVLAAKFLANAVMGAVFGIVATVATAGGAAAVFKLRDDPTFLGDPEIRRILLGSVIALTVWALMGVALGAVLPNQIAAVVVILGFTQLLEPVLRLLLGAFRATDGIAPYLPGAAADAIVGQSLYTLGSSVQLLTRPAGLGVMLGYVLALGVIGRFTTFRRDVT